MGLVNGKVIDPNDVISSLPNYVNGAPEYEKMYIFAELIARRRGRTTIVRSGFGTSQQLEGLENDISVNMMGFDQDTKEYTTRYSRNTSNSKSVFEGFGITKIDVKINASYVPQVTIDFVDIRGMAFANQGTDSPYSVLIDFPPPTFTLTLKGYYGRSLTYNLHLTKNSLNFDSSNGNYNITSEFIASTYAPLSDVPFKYIEMFPLIDIGTQLPPETTLNPNGAIDVSQIPDTISNDIKDVPKNTYSLINNIKLLYDSLKDLTDNSQILKEYKETLEIINNISVLGNKITNFGKFINIVQNSATLAIIDSASDTGSSTYFREITTLADYNTVITTAQANGIKSNFPLKLYLLVLRKTIKSGNIIVENTEKDKTTSASLLELRKELLEAGNRIDKDISKNDNSGDILPIKTKDSGYTPTIISRVKLDEPDDVIEYFGIDVTVLYQKLYKKWNERKLESKDKRQEFINEINVLAEGKLGLKPTIYNIFKIICDDVDIFFDKLRHSTIEGEKHHEEFKKDIFNEKKSPDKKVGGYPRYVKMNETGKSTRKARHIPDRKEFPNMRTFPEVKLVDSFVDTFANIKNFQKVSNMKTKTDAEGRKRWIPITPADSIIYNTTDYQSPYLRLYYDAPQSAIISIYERVLNRFYIGSEFTFNDRFFKKTDNKKRDIALVEYIAAAEASNLVVSINKIELLNALKTAADEYKTPKGLSGFYNFLDKRNVNGYSSFNSGGTKVDTSPLLPLSNGEPLYRQRENSNFTGIKIIENDSILNNIEEVTTDGEISSYKAKDIVQKFVDEIKPLFLSEVLPNFFGVGGDNDISKIENFTNENIPYFKDTALGTNSFYSDFIVDESLPDAWSIFLSTNNKVDYDTRFKEILETSEYNPNTKLFIISANSTRTMGFMYDGIFFVEGVPYGGKYTSNKFKYPAFVQTPVFALIYMGGIVKYSRGNEPSGDAVFKNQIDKYFTDDIGVKYVDGDVVSAGLRYISKESALVENLSENDKDILERYFDRKLSSTYYGELEDYFKRMINEYDDFKEINEDGKKEDYYKNALEGTSDYNYGALSGLLSKREAILNISELTFNKLDETNEFVPLTTLTGDTTIMGETIPSVQMRNIVDTYFKKFFTVVSNNITLNLNKIQKEEVETQNLVSDDDIRTQTYYSFKSLSDKWLPDNRNVNGFPFNTGADGGESLIDKFLFVDRGMNPIGDECIINIESLLDSSKNYDISVFNAMARLLSVNNFEFFPIANFMAFTDEEWENTFKIFETVNQAAPPAFVCMYLGGTSTTQSGDRNAFDNDGILDLDTETDIGDIRDTITYDENKPNEKIPQEVLNARKRFVDNDPYGRISAFKVRYAEQNQSFFKNIQIDTREFPETNESLAILSKLAGDESSTSPVAKGQNLFSIYESRAYSANVEMLGNMMIQPTQYFQLENIPIFNGAYMILSVNHNFTANHATTSFSGTKILKYPNPFITDVASSIALIGGTGNDFLGEDSVESSAFGDSGQLSPNNTDPNVRTETNNSMYELKLK